MMKARRDLGCVAITKCFTPYVLIDLVATHLKGSRRCETLRRLLEGKEIATKYRE